ncbi:hypothetical protein HZU40_04275 [Mycolicibacterium fluoranthenivorans]|jgi:hypothetical protein|uniref:Uncharacterized protein n=1 Tax=Mycolicibacterium fluoranthenivorans TaxID=258505 RepID=A0A7G8PGU8_9MYCO|nr:hypothetical protein [Mycolicibacterium fluoranthenivorans]QNJ93564.1 hypothetical protein HZU40_04275 [Mycolicibacterium fluoranthenivorans]
MPVVTRWLLRVPDLDEIRSGTMYLTVPLVDDMVQIGLGGQYRTGTLEVCKSRAALTVIRTDGAPLQAQIVRDGARITVLREPVQQLQLTRGGPAVWLVPGGVPVGRVADLEQLVRTVATFGVAKQRRGERAAPTSAAV